ncbi:MAG: hypothetical protein AB7T63_00640 [Planctomycetota bacterium]
MRGLKARLAIVAVAMAAASCGAPASTNPSSAIDEASLKAYGQAWFQAIRARDPRPLWPFLPDEALARAWQTRERANGRGRDADVWMSKIDRDGGWQVHEGMLRRAVQHEIEAAAALLHDPDGLTELADVSAASLQTEPASGPGRRVVVVLSVRRQGVPSQLAVVAAATPQGARLPASPTQLVMMPPGRPEILGPPLEAGPAVTMHFELDVEAGLAAGIGGPQATRESFTLEALARLRSFIRAHGLEGLTVLRDTPGRVMIHGTTREPVSLVAHVLADPEPTQLRLLVRPLETYDRGARYGPGRWNGPPRPRMSRATAPWQGAGRDFPASQKGYDEFLAHANELRRSLDWDMFQRRMLEAGFETVVDYTLFDSTHGLGLLEAETDPIVLDHRLIQQVRVVWDVPASAWAVEYTPSQVGAAVLGGWSRQNAGLDAAITQSRRCIATTRLEAPLDRRFVVPLLHPYTTMPRVHAEGLAMAAVAPPLPGKARLLMIETH